MVNCFVFGRRALCAWCCGLFLLLGSVMMGQEATLRLVGKVGDRSLEKLSVKKGQIVATLGEQSGRVPAQTEWVLEGDLATNAHLLHLSPSYSTERVPTISPKASVMGGFSHSAKLSLYYAVDAEAHWSQRAIDQAVIVFAWVVDGRATRVGTVAVTHRMEPADRVAHIEFLLDGADAERGFPAILLWKNGAFLPPEPWFRDQEANAWLVAAHFPPAGGLPKPTSRIAAVRGKQGVTLLHIMAETGNDAAVGDLLAAGAKPMAGERNGGTPGQWAARCGRTGALAKLTAAGANLDRDNGNGQFPLHLLITARHDSGAAVLVTTGARFDRKINGVSFAELALDLGLTETLRAIQIRRGLEPLRGQFSRRLVSAIRGGETELGYFLLEHGADPNARHAGEPALVSAARRANGSALIKPLLRAGADVNAINAEGLTPLAVATRAAQPENVSALLEARADPNRADRSGRTPLHFAVSVDAQIARALLAAGADVTRADQKGATALDLALGMQNRAIVAALLGGGARIDLKAKPSARMLADAIVLDIPELLVRAMADGWKPGAAAFGTRPAPALARYAGATAVAAWLKQQSVPDGSELATVGAGDTPPQPDRVKPLADARHDDRTYPEGHVMVAAIVEADGSLSHPIVATREEELRASTLETIRGWRFKPARHADVSFAVAVKFPVVFPAKDNRIYSLNEVDVVPDVRRTSDAIRQLAMRFEGSGLRFVGASMVGFVVEKDGRVRDVILPENLPPDYADTLRQMVTEAQFSPALRRGQAVRAWVEMRVGFNITVNYVVDESYRYRGLPGYDDSEP